MRLTAKLLCCILLQGVLQVNASTRIETHRSSVFKTLYDYALLANTFSIQAVADFLTCAQLCLADSRCMSVNFNSLPDNGLCELNTDYVDGHLEECTRLFYKKGAIYAQLLDISLDPTVSPEIPKSKKEYVFTTLGASGRFGPTDTSEYNGTLLAGNVTLSNGIQLWTVPETGNYVMEAFGAAGANGTCQLGSLDCTERKWKLGGLGAITKGTFYLKKGTKLNMLVGQEGSRTVSFGTRPGGGGGGTFVVSDGDIPLIIAGGGGGGAQPKAGCLDGGPGLVGEDGGVCGGSAGSGGLQCNVGNPGAVLAGATGAGFKTNGLGFRVFSPGSYSYMNGGKGGVGPIADVQGSFGGGGFGMDFPGGGGGYSGGGLKGSSDSGGGAGGGGAGGGGSYNNGTLTSNREGSNKGDGKVIITYN